MPDQIFISYRRDDAAYVTGHINDVLRKEFGNDAVFTDVDNIALGVDFRAVLDETVSQCHVLLAVIGSAWLSARDQEGQLRLHDPGDFVRIEIESALKRDIPVIPLLVAGATMPAAEDLPESLRGLAYRNGMQIRPGPDFGVDVARLVKSLRRYFAIRRSSDEAKPEYESADSVPRGTETAKKKAQGDVKAPAKSPVQKRAAATLRVEVDADDRERHSAEIGQARRKARRAQVTGAVLIAAVIAAGAFWYFSGKKQEPLETAALAVEPEISEPTQANEENAGPQVAVTPGGEPPAEIRSAEPANAEPVNAESGFTAEPDEGPDLELLQEISVNALELQDSGTEVEAPAAPREQDVSMPVAEPQPGISEYLGDGVRLAAIGDHEAAIRSFDQALAINPDAAFVYKQRGASYQALRDYEAAISDFDEVIRLTSDDVNAYYRRGMSYQALEDYAAAIADFDAALELDPNFVDIYARRADAYEAMGNDEAAALDRAAAAE
jgi:tetratricopeptide (TPR) repeat protein